MRDTLPLLCRIQALFQCGHRPPERKARGNVFFGKKARWTPPTPRPPCVKGAVRVSGLGDCRARSSSGFLLRVSYLTYQGNPSVTACGRATSLYTREARRGLRLTGLFAVVELAFAFFQRGRWPLEKAWEKARLGKVSCPAQPKPRPPCVKGAVRVSGLGDCLPRPAPSSSLRKKSKKFEKTY